MKAADEVATFVPTAFATIRSTRRIIFRGSSAREGEQQYTTWIDAIDHKVRDAMRKSVRFTQSGTRDDKQRTTSLGSHSANPVLGSMALVRIKFVEVAVHFKSTIKSKAIFMRCASASSTLHLRSARSRARTRTGMATKRRVRVYRTLPALLACARDRRLQTAKRRLDRSDRRSRSAIVATQALDKGDKHIKLVSFPGKWRRSSRLRGRLVRRGPIHAGPRESRRSPSSLRTYSVDSRATGHRPRRV